MGVARSPIFWAGVLILAASVVFAVSNRYAAGPLAPGVTWTLDRFTGKMVFCGVTGCVEPEQPRDKAIPALPPGFHLDKKS